MVSPPLLKMEIDGLGAKRHCILPRTCYAELVEALAGAADTGPVWSTSVFQSGTGH